MNNDCKASQSSFFLLLALLLNNKDSKDAADKVTVKTPSLTAAETRDGDWLCACVGIWKGSRCFCTCGNLQSFYWDGHLRETCPRGRARWFNIVPPQFFYVFPCDLRENPALILNLFRMTCSKSGSCKCNRSEPSAALLRNGISVVAVRNFRAGTRLANLKSFQNLL